GASAALLRRASAATRHLVWVLAVLSLCVVPVVSAIIPRWSIAVLPRALSPATALTSEQARETSEPFRVEVLPQQILVPANERLPSADWPKVRQTLSRGWTSSIVIVWVIGVAVVMARLIASVIGVWRKHQLSAPLADRDWTQLVRELASQYAIR